MTRWTVRTRTQRRRVRTRGGYALVLFVFLIWVFVGLAALVIDLGFVRLTQRQMQTAADSAALDALRFPDSPKDWAVNLFDESTGLVVGPRIEFEAGIAIGPPGFHAAERIVLPPADNRHYRPRFAPDENAFYGVYDSDGNFVTDTASNANAALVRLSRSPDNPDANGDRLPSLFARASLVPGFSVRYTGIAAAGEVNSEDESPNPIFGRAVAVGPRIPLRSAVGDSEVLGPGYARYAVERSTWEEGVLQASDFRSLRVDAGLLYVGCPVPFDIGAPVIEETTGDQIPIYSAALDNRIVGFGVVTVDAGGEIRRHDAPMIASENATASFAAVPRDLPPDVLADVLPAFENLPFPLVCPVLVQQYIGPTPN